MNDACGIRRNVLLLDDDIDFCLIVGSVLERSPEYVVSASCRSTKELLEALERLELHVLIVDLVLGSMDEPHLPALIDYCRASPQTVVLVLSSLAQAELRRSLPVDLRSRFGFLPKSSALSASDILAALETLWNSRSLLR